MNRKARDFESRRQIEDLNRYRKQNADLMREADHTIEATKKLEASMAQIGQIVCRDKRDAKSIKIQECLAQLRHDTKQFDQTMRECCTEPGQRLETLYKNIDKSITHRETMEAKSREKELRRNKIRDKYAQSMRPVNKQKVEDAEAEFDFYDRERKRIRTSLENDLPQLIKLLPMTLGTSRDMIITTEQEHRQRTLAHMRQLANVTSTTGHSKIDQNYEDQMKILAKIRKLKICSTA